MTEITSRVVRLETEVVDIKKDTAKIDDLMVNSAVVVEGISQIKEKLEELSKIDAIDKRLVVVETDVKSGRRWFKGLIAVLSAIAGIAGVIVAVL